MVGRAMVAQSMQHHRIIILKLACKLITLRADVSFLVSVPVDIISIDVFGVRISVLYGEMDP